MFGQRELGSTDIMSNAPSAPAVPVMPTQTSSPLEMPATIQAVSAAPTPLVSAPSIPSFSSTTLDSPMPSTPIAAPLQASPAITSDSGLSTDDLVSMKQEALKHLQPLVDTLEQTPEEEFRTMMMMIQATDDKTMLKKALESAKRIKDDKIRAQAMLDVINEINYFTQTSTPE